MDDQLKNELAERIGRIEKNQLFFDVGPDVPPEISAAIMLLHEVSDVSSTASDSMAKSIQSATGVSEEKLAAEMFTWFDGSLDQPPPINKETSLAIGYLANLYLHSKLCDEISKGPQNIGNIALSLEDMQKGLFRLVCAGLNSDPLLASNEGIRSALKKITEPAHEKIREKGRTTREKVETAFKKRTWRKPYNISRIAGKISEETNIPSETIRPILSKIIEEDKKGK